MDIRDYVIKEKSELKIQIKSLERPPFLAIVQVGDNPASNSYIRGKEKDASEVGIQSQVYHFDNDVDAAAFYSELQKINDDPSVDGLLVQLPVPPQLSSEKINQIISPNKDVDGFVLGSHFLPCTPRGILDFLSFSRYEFTGKNALVIGRSRIVGKPMADLLLNKNMNVTICHSKTPANALLDFIASADLIVVAVGHQAILKREFKYKKDAWVIDVGINRDENGKLVGDAEKGLPVAYQSPVPGGVGLLTRLALLKNLVEAMKR